MTKQQMDAMIVKMGSILPVQNVLVCEVITPCIATASIENVLKISAEEVTKRLLPEINYVTDDNGMQWVTVEALMEFVKGRQKLPNKAIITAYLQSLITSEETAEA